MYPVGESQQHTPIVVRPHVDCLRTTAQMFVENPTSVSGMADLTGAICRAVFVAPRIVEDGAVPNEEDDEIALDWLGLDDKMTVFTHVMGKGDDLVPFPEAAGGDVEAAPAGDELREEAE